MENVRKKYKRKYFDPVVAIRINLDTPGLIYEKWGGGQVGKQGDWLIQKGKEVYTIDSESFSKTYKKVSQGLYIKKAPVWSYRAAREGKIKTKEGHSQYKKGDWIVSNDSHFVDQYPLSDKKFRSLYEVRQRYK